MSDLTPSERDALASALHDGPDAPSAPELAALASRAETRGRTARVRRRTGAAVLAAAAVAAVFVVPAMLGGADDPEPEVADEPSASGKPTAAPDVPADCLAGDDTGPAVVLDEPEWIRFCPGPDADGNWAQMPADTIEPDAAFLAAWRAPHPVFRCAFEGPDFRVQLGKADGSVSTMSGDSVCNGSWLYDALTRAYGRYYADRSGGSPEAVPLSCPSGPDRSAEADRDGASAELDLGVAMPLTATGGIVCSWNAPTTPQQHTLTPEQAETLRVQLHAVPPSPDGCGVNPRGPSYVVVLADRTGTHRAISIVTSDCDDGTGAFLSTVSSSFADGPHGIWRGPILPE